MKEALRQDDTAARELFMGRREIIYEGSFVKGLYEGQGTLYRNGKKVYVGAFAGGIPQGEGKAYGNSGRADSWGTYADGEFVAGRRFSTMKMEKSNIAERFQTVSMKEKAAYTQTES